MGLSEKMDKELILILGGARSGKSSYAQELAGQLSDRVLYVATAQAGDDEMQERIVAHRASRPDSWETVEAPLNVASALHAAASDAPVILLDCLTMLVSNVILSGDQAEAVAEERVSAEVEALYRYYEEHAATMIIVSNEVGMGLVPPYPLGRVYRDTLGRANQRLAAWADKVLFLVAGIPLDLKKLAVHLAI